MTGLVPAIEPRGARPPGPPAEPPPPAAGGLTSEEARRRLAEAGPNEITRTAGTPPWRIFLGQFRGAMIWLLFAACALSAVLGHVTDAAAIGAIVVLNALVGFIQEFRAEKAVLALRSMTAPRARVVRDGHAEVIPAAEVVPGDRLVLEAGDVVAADARLVQAHALRTNEAPLTGESAPVEKSSLPAAPEAPLAERTDTVFLGTAVATGTGLADVTATGMRTELGKIAGLLAGVSDEKTPLQRDLARVGMMLLRLCLAVVAVIAVTGLLRGHPLLDVLLSSVSLAVAAVPEGLAAVVTIALAIGVQRMASQNVLIRRLPSVETLGCATVICTDKTGTLTTGVMAVRELWGPDHKALLDAAAACCDAELHDVRSSGTGDPTEIAILRAALERGTRREEIEKNNPRVAVQPFDSDSRRMSVFRRNGILYVKGAVEVVLERCTSGTAGAREMNAELAGRGLRVLAVAVGTGREERDLTLLGLIGISDPPRTEAIEAIAHAREAGVRTVMITGDHPTTANAIAQELGVETVHARATAADKIEIVRQWKSRGEIVAMTGDGVNDAPAIREAHIGIAMGRSGTEVTREASDMILADDNFASIVAAVREGRGVFDNIQKTLVYLLAGNGGELALMLGASILGMPLPLLPLHLLWINLVTDGLPALTLVMDPASADVLRRPPRRPGAPILGRPEWRLIGFTAALEALLTLSVFAFTLRGGDLVRARDFAFSTLVFAEVMRAFAARSPRLVFWEVGAFTNLRLVGAVALTVFLQVSIHHLPFFRSLFDLSALSLAECMLALLLGLIPVTVLEISKLVHRWWPADVTVGGADVTER